MMDASAVCDLGVLSVCVTATLSMNSKCDRTSKKSCGCQCLCVWDNLHVRGHR